MFSSTYYQRAISRCQQQGNYSDAWDLIRMREADCEVVKDYNINYDSVLTNMDNSSNTVRAIWLASRFDDDEEDTLTIVWYCLQKQQIIGYIKLQEGITVDKCVWTDDYSMTVDGHYKHDDYVSTFSLLFNISDGSVTCQSHPLTVALPKLRAAPTLLPVTSRSTSQIAIPNRYFAPDDECAAFIAYVKAHDKDNILRMLIANPRLILVSVSVPDSSDGYNCTTDKPYNAAFYLLKMRELSILSDVLELTVANYNNIEDLVLYAIYLKDKDAYLTVTKYCNRVLESTNYIITANNVTHKHTEKVYRLQIINYAAGWGSRLEILIGDLFTTYMKQVLQLADGSQKSYVVQHDITLSTNGFKYQSAISYDDYLLDVMCELLPLADDEEW